MTSDKELEAMAEEYCVKMGALIHERTDGKPVLLANLRAIAEVNAKQGFLEGASAGMRLQASRDAKLCDDEASDLLSGFDLDTCEHLAAAIRAAAQGDGK